METQIGRQVERLLVLEAGLMRKGAKPDAVEECVDLPAAAEFRNRLLGCRLPSPLPEIVTDDQHSAGANQLTALVEEPNGVGRVDERFDGKREVGPPQIRRQVQIIACDARHPTDDARVGHAIGRTSRLYRAERDAGAANGQTCGEIAQAAADPAAQIHDVWRIRRESQSGDQVGDSILEIAIGSGPVGNAGRPHRAVNGAEASALTQRDKV